MSNKKGKIIQTNSGVHSRVLKVMKMPITLAEFIKQDMESRRIDSQRAYAEFVGCAPSTIGEYTNKEKGPTIEFLRQLSKATHTSLRDLFVIAYPEISTPDDIDPQWKLLYSKFKNLPQSVQDFILAAMTAMEH